VVRGYVVCKYVVLECVVCKHVVRGYVVCKHVARGYVATSVVEICAALNWRLNEYALPFGRAQDEAFFDANRRLAARVHQ
jgi:hypothetical protein